MAGNAVNGTLLDYKIAKPGYFRGTWPVECGGSRRQKLVGSPGLNLAPGERLASITRESGGWAVMFIQRGPGELYLQCGAALADDDGTPPVDKRPNRDFPGWLERVDPDTLETIDRSPDLPSGGHLWCGAAVAHENGDLYTVNGRFCHRLAPDCQVLAERELPYDGPYNGLLVLSDGNLAMKNLGHKANEPCWWTILEPERLEPIGEPLVMDEPCMGRFSSDLTDEGEFVYFTTNGQLRRMIYDAGKLTLDSGWGGSYLVEGEDQSAGWDTTIGGGSVWMMDMGSPPTWERGWAAAPQRAFRFSIADPSDRDVIDEIKSPNAFNPGPPLYCPERQILVHYDTIGGAVVAHRYTASSSSGGSGGMELLWRQPFRNSVQMILYADTGELVVEDSPNVLRQGAVDPKYKDGAVVVVDIETGEEKGRAPTRGIGTMGMFMCPGFKRDFYVGSIAGEVARVYVEEEAKGRL